MARIRQHGRNADDAAADLANEEFAAVPPVATTAPPAAPPVAPNSPRWLVSIPGCHPEDLVIGAATEADAVEIYKTRLGITLLPVPAVVTPAPDDAPAPE